MANTTTNHKPSTFKETGDMLAESISEAEADHQTAMNKKDWAMVEYLEEQIVDLENILAEHMLSAFGV